MIIPLGGGGSKVVASIVVSYPAGSTLTCTLGSKVLTAKDTSGRWVFGLPSTGNWVVKITKDGSTKSQTVSVAEGDNKSITISFRTYLFKSGGGGSETWKALAGGHTTATVANDKMSSNGGSQVYYFTECGFTTENAVDLTGASKVVFDLETTIGSASSNAKLYCGVSTEKFTRGSESSTMSVSKFSAYTTIAETTARSQITLDVSSLSGSYYIAPFSSGLTITTSIYNVWLE